MARSWVEPQVFAAIFERHFPAIHRYLARRLGSGVADDLAGEVFRIAFQRRCDFDPGRENARPWLYGIATNLVRGHRRNEMRRLGALQKLEVWV